MKSIKISLVDNDPLLTESMARLLSQFSDIHVVNWHNDSASFIKWLTDSNEYPDIVITAFRMKKLNGLEICRFISDHFPGIRSILLAENPDRQVMENAICNGAKAFLLKGEGLANLHKAIINVYEFGIQVNDQLTLSALQKLAERKYVLPREQLYPTLTNREKQIIRLICKEYSSYEIGKELGISRKTVEGMIYRLRKRLGIKKSVGLVVFALRDKIMT